MLLVWSTRSRCQLYAILYLTQKNSLIVFFVRDAPMYDSRTLGICNLHEETSGNAKREVACVVKEDTTVVLYDHRQREIFEQERLCLRSASSAVGQKNAGAF